MLEQAALGEDGASSSHLPVEPDSAAMQVDSDDAMLSRSNSVQPPHEEEGHMELRRSVPRRDKGKGKERVSGLRGGDEPSEGPLGANDASHPNPSVSSITLVFRSILICLIVE